MSQLPALAMNDTEESKCQSFLERKVKKLLPELVNRICPQMEITLLKI